jgi:hypothetical protein
MTQATAIEKNDSKNNKKVAPVNTIVTHLKTHLDEIVAIMLLKMYGEEFFPGINDAEVKFWEYSHATPDGRSAQEWLEEDGVLFVGICGSIFDEHNRGGSKGSDGDCTTTLVAKYVGIENDPAWEKIIKYTHKEDLKAGSDPMSLGPLVKLAHQADPENTAEIFSATTLFIMAKYHEQRQFFEETQVEFKKVSTVHNINGPRGEKIVLAVIKSDDLNMNKLARSKHGCSADIVIQKRSSGNVQVFTNQASNLKIYDLVQILRVEEQLIRHDKLMTSDWKKLAENGSAVGGATNWYFLEEGQMLLNGSDRIEAEPTIIPFNEIVGLVILAMDTGVFDYKRSATCLRGNCISSRNDQCPMFVYGLHRCRKIRFESKKNNDIIKK